MNALSLIADRDRRRVVAVAGLMTSSNDGEALSALRAACRLLAPHGLRPSDLFEAALSAGHTPPAEHQELVKFCQAYPERLTDWEVNFLRGIAGRGRLSARQYDRLHQIVRSVEDQGCDS